MSPTMSLFSELFSILKEEDEDEDDDGGDDEELSDVEEEDVDGERNRKEIKITENHHKILGLGTNFFCYERLSNDYFYLTISSHTNSFCEIYSRNANKLAEKLRVKLIVNALGKHGFYFSLEDFNSI